MISRPIRAAGSLLLSHIISPPLVPSRSRSLPFLSLVMGRATSLAAADLPSSRGWTAAV